MTEQNSPQNYEDDFASYLHNPYGFKTKAETKCRRLLCKKTKVEPLTPWQEI